MIRINLLGEKVDHSAAHFLQLIGLGLLLVVAIVSCVLVKNNLSDKLEVAEQQKSELELQLNQLRAKTKKVEELEKNKSMLQEKLMTIARLKAKKRGPIRMLDQLNISLPERAWLNSIEERSGSLHISGVAVDNPTIAQFMAELGAAVFFGAVDLVHSKLHIRDDVELKEFQILAQLVDPLALKNERMKAAGDQPSTAKSEEQLGSKL